MLKEEGENYFHLNLVLLVLVFTLLASDSFTTNWDSRISTEGQSKEFCLITRKDVGLWPATRWTLADLPIEMVYLRHQHLEKMQCEIHLLHRFSE